MANYDIIIRKGTIVDGTRTPRYVSDIAIKDGRVAKIGGLNGGTADREINAEGLIVAPGFVDLHTHYDAQIFWDPYCTLSGWHGVTSVALGNCGFGFAPSRVEGPGSGHAQHDPQRGHSLRRDEGRDALELGHVPRLHRQPRQHSQGRELSDLRAADTALRLGHGLGRGQEAPPTEDELQEMVRLIHEAMDHGACGWSAQVLGVNSVQRDYDGTPMIPICCPSTRC